jgi:hypothetical protein
MMPVDPIENLEIALRFRTVHLRDYYINNAMLYSFTISKLVKKNKKLTLTRASLQYTVWYSRIFYWLSIIGLGLLLVQYYVETASYILERVL